MAANKDIQRLGISAHFFMSDERTATGSQESIAHGLGGVPNMVFVIPTDLNIATVGAFTVTEGTHDATSVLVTVTTNKKYKVLALFFLG